MRGVVVGVLVVGVRCRLRQRTALPNQKQGHYHCRHRQQQSSHCHLNQDDHKKKKKKARRGERSERTSNERELESDNNNNKQQQEQWTFLFLRPHLDEPMLLHVVIKDRRVPMEMGAFDHLGHVIAEALNQERRGALLGRCDLICKKKKKKKQEQSKNITPASLVHVKLLMTAPIFFSWPRLVFFSS